MPWKNSWFQIFCFTGLYSFALLLNDYDNWGIKTPHVAEIISSEFNSRTSKPSALSGPGQSFTAGNGMEMVWVAPMNGWVGKYLVTQSEYKKVMATNPSTFSGFSIIPRRPVESVSWNDTMAYCQMLTDQDHASGILPSGYKYNLPTSAQYDIFVDHASLEDSIVNRTGGQDAEVGTKGPNEFGLYDTRGNVSEWCLDWFHKEMISDRPVDDGGGQAYRVHRGSSFWSGGTGLLTSYMWFSPPDDANMDVGFRCVVIPPP